MGISNCSNFAGVIGEQWLDWADMLNLPAIAGREAAAPVAGEIPVCFSFREWTLPTARMGMEYFIQLVQSGLNYWISR